MLIYHRLETEMLIAITDEPQIARQLQEQKQSVIGILSPKSVTSDWSGVSYLSEDITLLSYVSEENRGYCREVCYRMLGLPMVIGQFQIGEDSYIIREMVEDDVNQLYPLYEEPHWKQFLEPLHKEKKVELEKIKGYITHSYPVYRCGIWSLVKGKNKEDIHSCLYSNERATIGTFINESKSRTIQIGRDGSEKNVAQVKVAEDSRRNGVDTILDNSRQEVIGRISLEYKEYGDFNGCFLGYALKESECGKGIATRACKLALSYGKEELGEEHIYAIIHKDNHLSINMAKRLGMKMVGNYGENGIYCGIIA